MTTREKIEATNSFKTLENTKKLITGKKGNIDYLKDNFITAKNIGYETWEKQCGTSQINKNIIKELIESL